MTLPADERSELRRRIWAEQQFHASLEKKKRKKKTHRRTVGATSTYEIQIREVDQRIDALVAELGDDPPPDV